MGYYCTVPQCTSLAGKTKNVKFHRFPRDEAMADKWNMILKRGKPYTKYSKVCSRHFTQADYNVTTMGQWKTLSKDAVPSQNLPKLNPDGTVMVIRKSRTVKYREVKKEEVNGEKPDKWSMNVPNHSVLTHSTAEPHNMNCDPQDNNLPYRYHQPLNMNPITPMPKPKKQDAFMQTDPVQSEEDDSQPNNSYNEVATINYQEQYHKEQKLYEAKDYTNKQDDYIPQTNEEYNNEAEKYALERKSLNGYEKIDQFTSKPIESYPKIPEVYGYEKNFRPDYLSVPNFQDSVELLRNQQHNLAMLQEQHRINENQNFFNENHIKQEDMSGEEDKFLYDRSKEQLDADMYNNSRRLMEHTQQRLLEQIQHTVKQEPEVTGCEGVIQPHGSPYYQPTNHNNVPTGGYYEQLSRPGPELLIAKQNALAAHTQLWQNTMKRPFFISDSTHYQSAQLLHRYNEDLTRILQ